MTQPLTYKLIRQHPSTLEIYSAKLREEGVLTAEEIAAIQKNHRAVLDKALEETRANRIRSVTDTLHGAWTGLERHDPRQIVVTEVNREVLGCNYRSCARRPARHGSDGEQWPCGRHLAGRR